MPVKASCAAGLRAAKRCDLPSLSEKLHVPWAHGSKAARNEKNKKSELETARNGSEWTLPGWKDRKGPRTGKDRPAEEPRRYAGRGGRQEKIPLRPNSQRLGIMINPIGDRQTVLDLLRPGRPSSPGSWPPMTQTARCDRSLSTRNSRLISDSSAPDDSDGPVRQVSESLEPLTTEYTKHPRGYIYIYIYIYARGQ
jgi:hypothetical protein